MEVQKRLNCRIATSLNLTRIVRVGGAPGATGSFEAAFLPSRSVIPNQ